MEHLNHIFRQTCFNRHFELKVAELHRQGRIKIPIYLSVGTEHVAAAVREAMGDCAIFPQHRCHSYFLSWGGDPQSLLKELLSQEGGCDGGMGGSASISIKGKMFGHDGLLGSNLPIAVGYAQASGRRTVVHLGDGAVEECYVLSGLGHAVTNKCPVLVIVENNGLSIKTPVEVRRSWGIVDVARGFGMEAVRIKDDPMLIYETVKDITLPALVEIDVCRHLWHAGSGKDEEPVWDRYVEMRDALDGMEIEREVQGLMTFLSD